MGEYEVVIYDSDLRRALRNRGEIKEFCDGMRIKIVTRLRRFPSESSVKDLCAEEEFPYVVIVNGYSRHAEDAALEVAARLEGESSGNDRLILLNGSSGREDIVEGVSNVPIRSGNGYITRKEAEQVGKLIRRI